MITNRLILKEKGYSLLVNKVKFSSITKKCETLSKQTHTKPQETLETKHIKSRKTVSFQPSISLEESWMMGLTRLEVYLRF